MTRDLRHQATQTRSDRLLPSIAHPSIARRSVAPTTVAPQKMAPQILAPQVVAPQVVAPQVVAPQVVAPLASPVRVAIAMMTLLTFAPGLTVWQAAAPSRADAATVAEQKAFIAAMVPGAKATWREFGVPASVTIAQAILESGWGSSSLTTTNNAYFGIKCKPGGYVSPYQAGCVGKVTTEYRSDGSSYQIYDYFRSYASADMSLKDHGYYLTTRGIYGKAFEVNNNPVAFAQAMAEAGYATDPQYAYLLYQLMSRHNLFQYDQGTRLGAPVAPPVVAGAGSTAGQDSQIAHPKQVDEGSSAAPTPTPSVTPQPSSTPRPSSTPATSAVLGPSSTPTPTPAPTPTASRTPSTPVAGVVRAGGSAPSAATPTPSASASPIASASPTPTTSASPPRPASISPADGTATIHPANNRASTLNRAALPATGD